MGAAAAGTTPSHGRVIRDRAAAHPDEVASLHVAADGTEVSCTWAWLDRRSDQLGAELNARGVSEGDRLGIGIRNSPEFVLAAFAAWKIGAAPIPLRWDLPDWELGRVQEVLAPRLSLSADDVEWIRATADDPVPSLLDAV